MLEFRWSGLNEHNARLQAGNELAMYINDCHQKCIMKLGERPAFILIGHSHGGNVILSSLGKLERDVALASIHLMGTPFLRYTEQPRWRTTKHDYHNLYASAQVRCPIHLYIEKSGRDIDEIIGLFSFMQVHKYFQRAIRATVQRLAGLPQRRFLNTHHVVQTRLEKIPPGNTILDLVYAKYEGSYPTRLQRFRGNVYYYIALLLWPLRVLVITIAAKIIAKTFATKLFHFVT
jgi:hypothetical protein